MAPSEVLASCEGWVEQWKLKIFRRCPAKLDVMMLHDLVVFVKVVVVGVSAHRRWCPAPNQIAQHLLVHAPSEHACRNDLNCDYTYVHFASEEHAAAFALELRKAQ